MAQVTWVFSPLPLALPAWLLTLFEMQGIVDELQSTKNKRARRPLATSMAFSALSHERLVCSCADRKQRVFVCVSVRGSALVCPRGRF